MIFQKRLLSVFLLIVFIMLLCLPAFAADGDLSGDMNSSLWDSLLHKAFKVQQGIDTIPDLFGIPASSWASSVWNTLDSSICPDSEDGYHHCTNPNNVVEHVVAGHYVYDCTCDFCGEHYNVTGESAKAAYDGMVDSLTSPVITSDGGVSHRLIPNGVVKGGSVYTSDYTQHSSNFDFILNYLSYISYSFTANQTVNRFITLRYTLDIPTYWGDIIVYPHLYVCTVDVGGNVYPLYLDTVRTEYRLDYPVNSGAGYMTFYDFNDDLYCFYYPKNSINVNTGNIYNYNNRIQNNFPDINIGNGTMIDNRLFNEQDMTFSNINGDVYAVQSFNYDYRNFSYNMTATDSSGGSHTILLTYGDESVLINIDGVDSSFTYIPITIPDSGSGSGDVDLSGVTSLLQQIKDKCEDILVAIGLIDRDINVDVEGDNITVGEGDDAENFRVKSIFNKFAFIGDIYDIGKTMIAQVSEDAAYAYDYDFGKLEVSDVDSGSGDLSADQSGGSPVLLSGSLGSDGPDNNSAGPPSIVVDLSAAQSNYGYTYGGETEILDLSWYTPYKNTVDTLLSAFLWIFFGWKLFQKAPAIISGSSMDSEKISDIERGFRS